MIVNIKSCGVTVGLNEVIKLRYGNTNTFFVRGKGANLLIDTDYAGTLPAFYKEIKKHGIKVNYITYILATHYHPDHVGLFGELIRQGATLLLIDKQTAFTHYSDEIFRKDGLKYEPIDETDALVITCGESQNFLKGIGINGEIVYTPSHSADSVCVLLDGGVCVAGDLEPIGYLKAYGDNPDLKRDWNIVLEHSPKIVYYSHANEKYFEQVSK